MNSGFLKVDDVNINALGVTPRRLATIKRSFTLCCVAFVSSLVSLVSLVVAPYLAAIAATHASSSPSSPSSSSSPSSPSSPSRSSTFTLVVIAVGRAGPTNASSPSLVASSAVCRADPARAGPTKPPSSPSPSSLLPYSPTNASIVAMGRRDASAAFVRVSRRERATREQRVADILVFRKFEWMRSNLRIRCVKNAITSG